MPDRSAGDIWSDAAAAGGLRTTALAGCAAKAGRAAVEAGVAGAARGLGETTDRLSCPIGSPTISATRGTGLPSPGDGPAVPGGRAARASHRAARPFPDR